MIAITLGGGGKENNTRIQALFSEQSINRENAALVLLNSHCQNYSVSQNNNGCIQESKRELDRILVTGTAFFFKRKPSDTPHGAQKKT